MSQKIDLQSIDAIIFDLGGVILNLDYNLTINAFKKLGGENFEQLYSQANQDKIFDKYEIGSISTQEFLQYLSQFLPNSSEDSIKDAWNIMLLDLPVERLELLRSLKKEYQMFLFSNTNELHYNSFTEQLNQTFGSGDILTNEFEQTYFSHLVGERKPNSSAFELVINEHQLNPQRTLFIDDSIQHIEGAAAIGLKTHHLVNSDIINILGKPINKHQ